MNKIVDYILIEFEDYETFNRMVKSYLNMGYQPFGAPFRFKKKLAFLCYMEKYAQAMVKYDPEI
jgi:hypothetical protein